MKETVKIQDIDIKSLFPQDETSIATMKNRTQAIADKSNLSLMSEELHSKRKLISFKLGEDSYCLGLDCIKEVLKDTSITNVPGTPDFIEGIMNLRGDYITVLNLKKFLNIQPSETQKTEKTPVIIVNSNDMDIAFLIDRINELFEVPEDKIIESGEGYYIAEFIYDNTPYTILNIEKIFTDKRIIVTDM